ncbi:hypothetical protein J8I87_02365 [Paraburkholderia sp. LEh10]|uniref:hypothetical protein n=1 Tax=Paraburkholderia sp. LEh10 TaxID=2821353 RepID=UPI001AE1F37D|nr:hypothetical protein [Paraburkholderia sp. LEh10]MBP0588579.1 hypothetical protein [Paraburkholderia sp. LEh10]
MSEDSDGQRAFSPYLPVAAIGRIRERCFPSTTDHVWADDVRRAAQPAWLHRGGAGGARVRNFGEVAQELAA